MGTYTPKAFPPRKVKENIYEYRKRVAITLGFDNEASNLLAASQDLNLVDAVRLLDRGCTHELALRILL